MNTPKRNTVVAVVVAVVVAAVGLLSYSLGIKRAVWHSHSGIVTVIG